MNKGIVLGMVILVIGMSFTGTTYSLSMSKPQMLGFDGNILYVGGNGSDNYSRIQDAIDDAVDGDTVYVYAYSSPYYENIVVNKKINLIGEDKETTVIDGDDNGDVIYVTADNVKISGFTIRNSGSGDDTGGIDLNSNFSSTVTSCIIDSNNGPGIIIDPTFVPSRYNVISGNYITANNGEGILIQYSNSNLITDNIITSNI